jgi:hypothetical protein
LKLKGKINAIRVKIKRKKGGQGVKFGVLLLGGEYHPLGDMIFGLLL